MVLLSAAVCNKNGKALVARQFVEMGRSRIEGLLAAFPRLLSSDRQCTFVETESVRYVYQPLDGLYVLLITTRESNILEDLETLKLFARVVPEYCRLLNEDDVCDHAFQLITAFDEVVALGYRESVSLSQIRTFTEMDSLEEREFIRQRKEREELAKRKMKEKAKQLGRDQNSYRDMRSNMWSGSSAGGGMGGYGGGHGHGSSSVAMSGMASSSTSSKPPAKAPAGGGGRALKLGSKKKGVDNFVDQLRAEGEEVKSVNAPRLQAVSVQTSNVARSDIHIKMEEKIILSAGRDSGLENMDVRGIVHLNITNSDKAHCRLIVNNTDNRNIQFQTHPNVDKKLFSSESVIGLKQASKAFPLNVDVPVLKWRFVSSDESQMPLAINCWPSENGGQCDVNIEYELNQEHLELQSVQINVPCPSGVGAPTVENADGEYAFDQRHSVLSWQHPVINADNKQGTIEFNMPGRPEDFFPVSVSFVSSQTFCCVTVDAVEGAEGDHRPMNFSQVSSLTVEKYSIE